MSARAASFQQLSCGCVLSIFRGCEIDFSLRLEENRTVVDAGTLTKKEDVTVSHDSGTGGGTDQSIGNSSDGVNVCFLEHVECATREETRERDRTCLEAANTTPNPRTRHTHARAIFLVWSRLESSSQQESLCLTKHSFFTSGTACRTRPRCCFLHT